MTQVASRPTHRSMLSAPLVLPSQGGGESRNCALASLVHYAGDTLLLTHRAGSTKTSADGTQHMWRSADAGHTWRRVVFPFSRTPSGNEGELRTAELSRLGPNRLAMLLTW